RSLSLERSRWQTSRRGSRRSNKSSRNASDLMRNISTMLANGNLTPRERFAMLAKDDMRVVRDGKGALTEADRAALEGWKAKTREEAAEWNRMIAGWKLSGRVEIEAQFHFNDAYMAHLRAK